MRGNPMANSGLISPYTIPLTLNNLVVGAASLNKHNQCPSEKTMRRTCTVLKNALFSVDFEPADFGSSARMHKVHNLIDLRQCIIKTVELMTSDMLMNTWRKVGYRFGTCRAINGAHVEVY
ncbi:hypothetical protein ANN_15370 [Periplaneta americana]|uniref:Uncharacterized protein n=1 Tax=Periplaneta americana TaxID=6978 RepID=A0ABQ8SGH5_PERAM|nr:hypothetical protein ANN_15370 [Periplaneta americana]